jgi:hypothetical protein
VIAVDGAGTIRYDLQDNASGYALVTGVREHDGRVYVSSLDEAAIAYFDLADIRPFS